MPTVKVHTSQWRGLLQFDLSSIGPGSTVQDARFSGYVYDPAKDGPEDLYAHNVTKDWLEAEVSWNNRKSATPWDSAGGDFEAGVMAQTYVDSVGWFEIDMTTKVQDWVNGATNNGFLLKTSEVGSRRIWFRSSDYSGDPTLRPKLTITCTAPAGKAEQTSIIYYIRDSAGNVIGTYKKTIAQ